MRVRRPDQNCHVEIGAAPASSAAAFLPACRHACHCPSAGFMLHGMGRPPGLHRQPREQLVDSAPDRARVTLAAGFTRIWTAVHKCRGHGLLGRSTVCLAPRPCCSCSRPLFRCPTPRLTRGPAGGGAVGLNRWLGLPIQPEPAVLACVRGVKSSAAPWTRKASDTKRQEAPDTSPRKDYGNEGGFGADVKLHFDEYGYNDDKRKAKQ